MKPKYFLFLCLSFLILNSSFLIGTVRYVSKTGTSTPPYTSWTTAADSIQKCINICSVGDTVYVASGSYPEKVIFDKFVYLIGLSQDSCIIDGSNELSEEVVRFNTDGEIANITIKARGQFEPTDCVRTFFTNVFIKNSKIIDGRHGFGLIQSSSVIENCIILYCDVAIGTQCPTDTCKGIYNNNVIISDISSPSILHFYGGSPTMTDNIILGKSTSYQAVSFEQQNKVNFKNNLISEFINRNVYITLSGDTAFLTNNNSINAEENAFVVGQKSVVRNNIIQNANTGIIGVSGIRSDYNLFNKVNIPLSGAELGEGNIFADPMFINDTVPIPNGGYDFHLQKYSPAIDAGDPNILDVDGHRSDIGMYGGPEGEKYSYLDLPPRTPKNFTTSFDTTNNFLMLNWDMNTESDFNNYNIYRDTISGFIPNEFNQIGTTDTSSFADYLSTIHSNHIYYRISAVDSQENESQPGNEIAVTITGIEPGVEILRDYILYQNYPNPFNPNTKIGYEIKQHSSVKLMVYDIKGELLGVLVNKEQNAGYYEVEFALTNIQHQESSIKGIASGIYLYRIEVIGEGNIPVYSDMKKMVLIK